MPPESSGYTVSTVRRRRRREVPPPVRAPADVYRVVAPLVRDAGQEHFYVLCLNTKNAIVSVDLVSIGTLNGALVHPREVFRRAILQSAAAIVLAHNHPSGDASPSPEDRDMTRRLAEAGRIVGIELLDHVIVADGHFKSLREEGLL